MHILVHKQRWGVRPRGFQVLHGVPLINAALLGADAALIVGGPDERHAPREVVVPSSHFAGLVKHLQGGPGGGEGRSGVGAWAWALQLTKDTQPSAVGRATQKGLLLPVRCVRDPRQPGTTLSSQRPRQLGSQVDRIALIISKGINKHRRQQAPPPGP